MNYDNRFDIKEVFKNPNLNQISKDVWHYEEHKLNLEIIKKLTKDIITPRMVESFSNNPPEHFNDEDFSWLDNLFYSTFTPYKDVCLILKNRILETFKYIRGYHATRCEDIHSFAENGIIGFSSDVLNETAIDIFISNVDGINLKIITDGINDAGWYKTARERGGEVGVNFVLNKHILLSQSSSHYLESGSEYIQCIAGKIDEKHNLKCVEALKDFGKPYLLVCNVPLEFLSDRMLQRLVDRCLYDWFRDMIGDRSDQYIPDGGFTIPTFLPADCIQASIEIPFIKE